MTENESDQQPVQLIANPWKDAVINVLVIQHTFRTEHEDNPELALADLVSWEVQVALDPAVSTAAQELYARGRAEAKTASITHFPAGSWHHHATVVLGEVMTERTRQEDKWDNASKDIPNFPPGYLGPEGLGVLSELQAKSNCDTAFSEGRGSYAHILVEEVAEALSEPTDEAALRKELVQVAAVATSWIEHIDRRKLQALLNEPTA